MTPDTPAVEETKAKEKRRVLRELRALGRKIERVPDLYEEQNKLILEGAALGLTAVEMARARQPHEDSKYIAESFRQKIREGKKPAQRVVKTRA